MNLADYSSVAVDMEPCVWLLLLLALFLDWRRRSSREKQAAITSAKRDEEPPNYRALGYYAGAKLLSVLAYLLVLKQVFSFGVSVRTAHHAYFVLFWVFFFLSTIFVFFVMEAVITSSLRVLPGLSTAARVIFRWVAALAIVLALTAHLPILGIRDFATWLDEVNFSFMLCVCAFEITLLVVLLTQLRRLGLCLRSRPIGLALGLTMLGCMDLVQAVTFNLSPEVNNSVVTLDELDILLVGCMWAFYILRPEPKRLPHGLSPASRLMKWNEIALKLGVSGKQAESVPFISGVESTVDAILERFKGRVG